MAETFGERMAQVQAPHGFDYLRIALAAGVLLVHSPGIVGDAATERLIVETPLRVAHLALVPMFFVLSGFLVAGSLERSRTLTGYLVLRAVRLLPALALVVLVSALVLGPPVTRLPLPAYFGSRETWTYLLNIAGWSHLFLPGVFADHPTAVVNGSLWTLAWEMGCYLLLLGLAVTRILRRPVLLAAAVCVFAVLVTVAALFRGPGHPPWFIGWTMVMGFLAGAALFQLRDRVPRSTALAWACAATGFAMLAWAPTRTLAMLPLGYFTVWLGLFDPPPSAIAGKADYSYGIYLFAWPVQQLVVLLAPHWPWYANALGAAVLSLLCAAGSWHLVERPALARKHPLVARAEAAMAQKRVSA